MTMILPEKLRRRGRGASAPPAPEAPVRPTREAVQDAIMCETGQPRNRAEALIVFWEARVEARRHTGSGFYHMREEDLVAVHDGMMELVMPDDAVAQPGSAHDLLEQLLLDPGLGETRLVHSNTANPPRRAFCCTVVDVK